MRCDDCNAYNLCCAEGKNKVNKKNIPNGLFWKIYLIFFILIVVYSYSKEFNYLGLVNLIDFIVSLPSLAALYGIAFKKELFKKFYWKYYFYFFVVWYTLINLFIPLINKQVNYVYADMLGTIVTVPLYIALYIYAFKFLNS